ncbi:hypothetical protein E4T39_00111 [Aureobasidium subglaciale]|nr:hypothetical protein E4T39_00111 [Aureobasidium subglaciale]
MKRSYSGPSPDPRVLPRKIGRFDQHTAYAAASNNGLSAASNPSSRRSSTSQANGKDQPGYGTPHSRSPTRNGNAPPHAMDDIPKALESFVLAVSKHNQSAQHLKNVQTDFDFMLPRYTDFPGLGTQKANRLGQAKTDFDTTETETAQATKILIEALRGYFPEQLGSNSHQDCISRSEFEILKEHHHENNRRMESKIAELEKDADTEFKHAKRSEQRIKKLEEHIDKLEETNRSLHEQFSKEKNSCRTRCSDLEQDTHKTRNMHKGVSQAVDAIRSSVDEHIKKAQTKHEEYSQKISLNESELETMRHKLDVDIAPKIKQNSETTGIVHKAVQDLRHRVEKLPGPYTPPAAAPAPSDLKNVMSRLASHDRAIDRLGLEFKEKDEIVIEQLEEAQASIDHLQVKVAELQSQMDKAQTSTEEVNPESKSLEEDLENLAAWKGLKTKLNDYGSYITALSENITRLKESNLSVKRELEASIDEVKQRTMQRLPGDLKPQFDHIAQTLENHVDLIQRHETRLNSVTTDELFRMMENQWRTTYGVPEQLRGLIGRQTKLESVTKNSYNGLAQRVSIVEGKAINTEHRLEQLRPHVEERRHTKSDTSSIKGK